MARDTTINLRLEMSERERLERLAQSAGLSTSEAMRVILRSATKITPARPATAVFERDNGANIRQDSRPVVG